MRETKAADTPSIEEQISQLKAAGWLRVNGRAWKAPVGGYFLGPHGAWLAMKRRAALAAIPEGPEESE